MRSPYLLDKLKKQFNELGLNTEQSLELANELDTLSDLLIDLYFQEHGEIMKIKDDHA